MTSHSKIPQTEPTDLEAARECLRALRKCLVRVRTLASHLIEPHGLTTLQFLGLYWVREREGITQAELAAELDSDANTVSAMVGRLVKRSLLTRKRHDTDGRAVCLHTTEAGRMLVSETQPDVDQLARHLLSMVPPGNEESIMAWLAAIGSLRGLS